MIRASWPGGEGIVVGFVHHDHDGCATYAICVSEGKFVEVKLADLVWTGWVD